MAEHHDDSANVAWDDVARFIRQFNHDLRNHLNAIELQSAFVSELTQDAELQGEIKRLREMISGLARSLQSVSSKVGTVSPNRMAYRAADFMEDLRKRVAQEFPQQNADISWKIDLGDEMIDVDPPLLPEAILELIRNAFQHGRGQVAIAASAQIDHGRFLFRLREPKHQFELPTENWGGEPLRSVGHGHYGLGLNRARRIVEAHDGEMQAQYDRAGAALVTTITLPVGRSEA
ncbi:MAG: sensor histidine kinase [Chthoniobacterales bacterium]